MSRRRWMALCFALRAWRRASRDSSPPETLLLVLWPSIRLEWTASTIWSTSTGFGRKALPDRVSPTKGYTE